MQERQFQRHPFRAVLGSRQLVEYVVAGRRAGGGGTGRFALADVQVGFVLCRILSLFSDNTECMTTWGDSHLATGHACAGC